MDEMGDEKWADAAEKVCLVPMYHAGDPVYYPVLRTGKRITLPTRVAADGSFVKPAVVIPRKTCDEDVIFFTMKSEKVERYSQGSGYVVTSIFDDELEKRREAHPYSGPAFLTLDSCPSHTSGDLDDLYLRHGIVPIFLPPQFTGQNQVFDLSIFGVTK